VEFCFRRHDHDVPAVVYNLYRVVLKEICEQDLCFLEEGEKTAHLECFVFNFHDFPTVGDYSCTGLFSREICVLWRKEEHIRCLLFTLMIFQQLWRKL